MRKFIFLFLFCLTANASFAQHLIPAPKHVQYISKRWVEVKTIDSKVKSNLSLPNEGYTIKIKSNKAVLRAKTQQGLIWAKATLSQLAENGKYPEVYIKDYPSFPIRGFMNDTGRNYRPVELLKKELDLFSLYKINMFHWHLTDNPAWRIECRAYPELNDPKNHVQGRNEGQFYTYKEIHDVIRYAKERGIMIIPEIDMPGHSQYFNRTFDCSMASEKGMKILKDCLEEFLGEITKEECPYIHIGSDEVHVANPKEFILFCENILKSHGRTPLTWNPGLTPSPETVVQIWYSSLGKKLTTEESVNCYLDSYQGYLNSGDPVLNTSRYFLHQACSVEKATDKALGGTLCLWNDVRIDNKDQLFLHNGATNGLLAFSERFWCGGTGLVAGEESLLPDPSSPLYQNLLEFEKRLTYHRDHFLYDWNMRWVANAHQVWNVTVPQPRGTSVEKMEWKRAWGGVIDMAAFAEKHHAEQRATMDAWMTTEIYAPKDTLVDTWIGFDVPGRANRKSAGIGYQGAWESDGRVFVNDTEIFPHKWKEPGKYQYNFNTWFTKENEIPYTNEQFYFMRKPVKISLKAGWNKVRLYCPRSIPGENWIVAFIPIHVDGNGHVSEVTCLKYR